MKNYKTVMQIVPALNTGGVERGVIEISKYIVENGYKSVVVSSGGISEHLIKRYGGHHFNLNVHTKNPLNWYFTRKKLQRIIIDEEVDLIHVCSRVPAWIALPVSRKLKIPIITSVHGRFKELSVLKNYYNSILLKGNYIIAISNYIKKNIISRSPSSAKKVKLIYRGVDLNLFNNSNISYSRLINQSKKMGLKDDKKIILMPARPTLWKGHLKLIEALNFVKEDFQCILIGATDGSSKFKNKLFSAIKKYDLGSRVKLTSSTNDIQAAMMLGDIIVVPSVDPEPFGRIAIEGQALGKVVIGFDHGGLSETIKDGRTGFLAKPYDKVDLSKKIETALKLSKVKSNEIAKLSKSNVVRRFSHLKMCEDTFQLYKKCINIYNNKLNRK